MGPGLLDVDMYRLEWRAIKARFGTFPGLAVAQADELLLRVLDGGPYRRPDTATRLATAELGTELRAVDRRDLRRFFDRYASALDEALASPTEITLEDPSAPEVIDLRPMESISGQRRGVG